MSVDTPQNRRRLQQLVRNEHPGCEAVFVDAPRDGLAFRIRARSGRFRSGVITLLGHHRDVRINSAWLSREMSAEGGPARHS